MTINISGPERDRFITDCVRRYDAGETIRQIADSTGYSKTGMRELLASAHVVFRARGGYYPRKSKAAQW